MTQSDARFSAIAELLL